LQIVVHTSEEPRVITARVEPELAEELARAARDQDRSQSAIVRRALKEHLGRQPVRVHVPEQEKEAA
jgi:predicted transcriptional regulator